MSLRVLLADESASIRKVFQMGLQDFGADVKSVHNGLDVIEVAENYRPDIIFADILLQKKNGYEVCEEIQQHAQLSDVPVILMWSSFMELDQKRYNECGAQAELEKPFDVESMRKLIKALVKASEPKAVQKESVSDYLNFPKSISEDFVEEERSKSEQVQQAQAAPQPAVAPPAVETPPAPEDTLIDDSSSNIVNQMQVEKAGPPPMEWDVEGITEEPEPEEEVSTSIFNLQAEEDDEDPDFSMYEVPRPYSKEAKESAMEQSNEEQWVTKPLNASTNTGFTEKKSDADMDQFQSFSLGAPEPVKKQEPQQPPQAPQKMKLDDFLFQPENEVKKAPTPPQPQAFQDERTQTTTQAPSPSFSTPQNSHGISTAEAEAIIRTETRQLLNKIIKTQLPEILERIVRQELEKVVEQEMTLKGSNQTP